MKNRLFGREPKKPPKSVAEVLAQFAHKAPDRKYTDGMENERPLSPKEKERLFNLLSKKHDEETRCAAAYVVGKLGLTREASSLINAAYSTCEEGSDLRFMLSFAAHCMAVMEDHGTAPPRDDQLPLILEMCDSPEDGIRRFAEIVLKKAGIKAGTAAGW